jgi:hypothetical protein
MEGPAERFSAAESATAGRQRRPGRSLRPAHAGPPRRARAPRTAQAHTDLRGEPALQLTRAEPGAARSMPALTPAEVHTRPSWMKRGSQSTISSGCSSASWRARLQWVVTRRPVTSPAAAIRKTPLQTDVTRRLVAPAALTQSTSARSARARSTPDPPATTSVSIPPDPARPRPGWRARAVRCSTAPAPVCGTPPGSRTPRTAGWRAGTPHAARSGRAAGSHRRSRRRCGAYPPLHAAP